MIKLDYSITSPQERNELVKKILEENPDINDKYLEVLADYLILCMERQERRERKILTDNRMVTVNKREVSFEGLVSQFENGEDGVYNLISNDKNVIFQPKVSITEKDLREIPLLKQLRDTIDLWETKLKYTEGRDAYVMKRALIELRRDQYIIKAAYRRPVNLTKITHSRNKIALEDGYYMDENGYPKPIGFSFLNPEVCSAVLCNYSKLKEDSYDDFEGDMWYLIYDFENLCDRALEKYPLYQRIVEYKIDGMPNNDIQNALEQEFGIRHSIEYISSLWRKKIPTLIANQCEDETLEWHYLSVERGKFKRCSRCGQIKLAHNKYFSKNKTSKDGFYSICKECRNKKVVPLQSFAVGQTQKN